VLSRFIDDYITADSNQQALLTASLTMDDLYTMLPSGPLVVLLAVVEELVTARSPVRSRVCRCDRRR
jgi:hypothetical protein